MDTKADRLRAARVARGFASAADAARALNIPYGTYSGHENNSRGFKDDEAERYADFFKVSIGWLIAGEGFSVPLISWVSAGGLLTADAVINLDDSTLLPIAGLPPGNWFALKVDGDSMDRISPPDSVIVVNRRDKRLIAKLRAQLDDATSHAEGILIFEAGDFSASKSFGRAATWLQRR